MAVARAVMARKHSIVSSGGSEGQLELKRLSAELHMLLDHVTRRILWELDEVAARRFVHIKVHQPDALDQRVAMLLELTKVEHLEQSGRA